MSETSSPSIARSTLLDSGAQILVMVFSLVAGVVLARVLGADGRDQYVFATAFAGQLVLGVVNFGVELSASVLAARNRERLSEIHTLLVLLCAGIFLLLLGVTSVAFEWLRTVALPGLNAFALLAMIQAMPFWVYQTGAYGLLVGMNQNRLRAGFDVVLSFAQNVLVVLLLLAPGAENEAERVRWLILSFYALIILGAICLGALLIKRGIRWRLPSSQLVSEFFSYGFWVYVGNMGATFSQRVDQYFVKQVSVAPGLFGVYNLATSLTNRTRIFPQALSRSAYARLCSAERREAAELTAACFRQMFALGLILCALGSLAAPLIPVIYSAEFAAAVIPFIIFLFGKLFQNCSWMLANFFSGHLAQPRTPMLVNWGLLPLQAVAAYFAMRWGGLVAVAVIASLSYALQFAVFLVLFLRAQKDVGLAGLFLIGPRDLAPWRRMFARRK